MQSETLQKIARYELKILINSLPSKNRAFFKEIYSRKDTSKTVSEIVDEMPADKLDIALLQAERTAKKLEA